MRVLFVLTSHEKLGNTGRKTGFFLPEIAHPYEIFHRAGYEMASVSPKGGEPPMDAADASDPVQKAFLDNPAAMTLVQDTMRPDQVNPAEYDAIFFVGGHGTMWDFPDNPELARIAAAIYENGGAVAAVCHGPAALVNITLSDGSYLVAGKEVAGFTNDEEVASELTEVVPFLLESKLIERGGRHTKGANFHAHVARDGRLVTGQNPQSARGVGEQMVAVLESGRRA